VLTENKTPKFWPALQENSYQKNDVISNMPQEMRKLSPVNTLTCAIAKDEYR
jgi:hypothetical protein